MNRVRILYVITDSMRAGGQRALLDLVSRLNREEFAPTVVALTGERGILDDLETNGVPTRALRMRRPIDLPRFLLLRGILEEVRPHVLHTFLFHANVAGRLLGRAAGVPAIISSIRGEYLPRSYRVIEGATLDLADRVLVVSDAVRRIYAPHGRNGRIEVLTNGVPVREPVTEDERVEARRSLGLDAGRRYLVTAARLVPEKGLEFLIRALVHVPDAELLLLGDGPLRTSLEEEARRSGTADRVRFLGHREDVHLYLIAANLFVLPSLSEGMPRSILEAMNHETPVVATTAGGIPETATSGVEALLVRPGDETGLAAALGRVLEEPGLGAHLATAAKERLRLEFSVETVVRRHEAIYRELTARFPDS